MKWKSIMGRKKTSAKRNASTPAERARAGLIAVAQRLRDAQAIEVLAEAGATEELDARAEGLMRRGECALADQAYKLAGQQAPDALLRELATNFERIKELKLAIPLYERLGATDTLSRIAETCLDTGDLINACRAFAAAKCAVPAERILDLFVQQLRIYRDSTLNIWSIREKLVWSLARPLLATEEIIAFAERLHANGHTTGAVTLYRLLLNSGDSRAIATERLSAIATTLLDADNYEEALRLCAHVGIALPQPAVLAFTQRRLGSGDVAGALRVYPHILDIADPETHLAIGSHYLAWGQVMDARNAFQRAGRPMLPPEQLTDAINMLLEKEGTSTLTQVLALGQALDTDTLLAIGRTFLDHGLFDWAEKAFTRARRTISPEEYVECGDAHLRQADYVSAVKAYRAALASAPAQ